MLYAYHKSCIGLQILRNGFEISNLEQAVKEGSLIIYPNPSSDIFNIKFNELIKFRFEIYDITGRLIKSIYFPKGELKVSVSLEEFSKGVYTYKQIVDSKVKNTGKLIKE